MGQKGNVTLDAAAVVVQRVIGRAGIASSEDGFMVFNSLSFQLDYSFTDSSVLHGCITIHRNVLERVRSSDSYSAAMLAATK